MTVQEIKKELKKYASNKRAEVNAWFFKTKKGEYGYGDIFIGVSMPDMRRVAKKFHNIELSKIFQLLKSKIHEERMVALILLTEKYEKAEKNIQSKIYNLYLKNTQYINNWDLVDVSAHKIVGSELLNKQKVILKKLARSKDHWERRIAIVATYYFIKKGKVRETYEIAKMLLKDDHDLIHKSVGWMLREAGKKNIKSLEQFLKKYYKTMPRTMLRYAIEKFPEKKRKAYLKGNI